MEDMFKYVKKRLIAARGQRMDIARESGVSYHTLEKIVDGGVKNPSIRTVQQLYNYLKSQDDRNIVA
jgi:predicted transcriptional regulator